MRYVSSYFSPNRGTADILTGFIDRCVDTIDVAVYSITHEKIVEALVSAKKRGVNIRVITDNTQAAGKWSKDEKLEEANIPVIRAARGWRSSMHHKFIIGDKKSVGTGSFNWTNNADKRNAENFVIIRLKYVVDQFRKEFDTLWQSK